MVRNEPQTDGYRLPSNYSWIADFVAQKATVAGSHSEREGWGTRTYSYDGETPLSYRWTSIMEPQGVERSYRDELRMKVLVNLKNEVLDAAMVLAEMQGTISLLEANLMRVARSMDAIKARKPESFRYLMHGVGKGGMRPTEKALRETAGVYLEWKYGIMPTMSDIAGASKALDINDTGELWLNPPLLVARAGLQDRIRKDLEFYCPHFFNPKVTVDIDIQAAARVDYSVSSEGLRGLSRYGVGLGTVGTIAFERTPFSFVLNMALPLAELIKAWTAISSGVNVRGYSETFYVSAKSLAGNDNPLQGKPGIVRTWGAEDLGFQFKRNGGSSVPMPMPFIRNPIKAGNMATILALFTQLRRKSTDKD